ncbi:hypothetical protein COV17_00910 [Candidatus Woesearchaeota archaeon CG10_big_fil_rev_8_21_14_0_10_36_11]|nr:MAG: hypothetical protein COV17_00910 [Candidatus Woesearchaeota archaeon CG10_big_fil_rev_8_21_14_0_10_36_11]
MNKLILCGACLVCVMLILVGCGSSVGEKATQYNFKQGTPELNVQLFDNAPPEKIYPKSSFKFIVELDNQAAYDVSNGKLSIIGLDTTYFTVSPKEQTFEPLLGRSLTSPAGDKIFVEFDGESHNLFHGSEQYSGNFILKAEYASTMEFVDTVCINPNLYDVYDAGCAVEETKSYSGQGAPLTVTRVEEIITPGSFPEIEFRLFLSNSGQGNVKDVTFMNAELGGKRIECQFQGSVDTRKFTLKETDSEIVLICKKQIMENLDSYMTTLSADFAFTYESVDQHSLTLVK